MLREWPQVTEARGLCTPEGRRPNLKHQSMVRAIELSEPYFESQNQLQLSELYRKFEKVRNLFADQNPTSQIN